MMISSLLSTTTAINATSRHMINLTASSSPIVATSATALSMMMKSSPIVNAVVVMKNWKDYFMVTSIVLNGMSAGIMFIFSNAILPALARLSEEDQACGITTMVTINDVILNGIFKFVFIGGFITSLLPTISMFLTNGTSNNNRSPSSALHSPARWYALASTIVYFLGQIVVTVTQNIPRNDMLLQLASASSSSSSLSTNKNAAAAASQYWKNEYLTKWVFWNTTRCIFSIVSTCLGILAFRHL